MPIAQLRHLAVEVTQLPASERFYDQFLGRLGFRRFARESDYLGYASDDLTVWVIAARPQRVRRRPIRGDEEVVADHLAFRVGSPQELGSIVTDLGRSEIYPVFRMEEHPEFRTGYVSASWADPDQTIWELYWVPEARRGAAARKHRTRPHRPAARGKSGHR